MRTLKKLGMLVSEQNAVVGCDDIPRASLANSALTTVKSCTEFTGDIIVESVLKLIRCQEVSPRLNKMNFEIRNLYGASIDDNES
jgi:DNA-binding LacI/PurR family transcriptional regulator